MSSGPLYNETESDQLEKSNVSTLAIQNEIFIEELGAGAAAKQSGILGKMWGIVKKIDKYGVEVRGIERVLPHERKPITSQALIDNLWMWLAANCTIPTLALGTLGPSVFHLSGRIGILVVIFFNLIGALPAAFFSTFGPKLGLRQMTITRFSFGYYVAMFPVVLNVIACIGWSTVNCIVGAQVLHAISTTHRMPVAAAIVIIAILTFFVPFFGYKVVHTYERYSWIPVAIIFFIVLSTSAQYMDTRSIISPEVVTGGVLSFGAAVFGFGVGWSSCTADYTVQMPEDVSSAKVFWLTYLGLNIPLILVESLGVGMATATRQDWKDAFKNGGVGGLVGVSLSSTGGFGKACMIVLALSIVANNAPSMYSFALTFQVLGRHAQAIPRVFLVFFGTIVYIILAIARAGHFELWLDTLLVITSYWVVIYCTILIEEHFIFRKACWENYNLPNYKDPTRLPIGIAAAVSMCFGILGAVLGMATQWYVGVLGRKIGDPAVGGDIGFQLSMAFTVVSYPVVRALERQWEGAKRRGRI